MASFHVKTTESIQSPHAVAIQWVKPELSPDEWIAAHQGAVDGSWRRQFEESGFIAVHDVIDAANLLLLGSFYDDIVSGRIDGSAHRHDLGRGHEAVAPGKEKILQIMWPADYMTGAPPPFVERGLALARHLLLAPGEPPEAIAFDFDMLISKSNRVCISVVGPIRRPLRFCSEEPALGRRDAVAPGRGLLALPARHARRLRVVRHRPCDRQLGLHVVREACAAGTTRPHDGWGARPHGSVSPGRSAGARGAPRQRAPAPAQGRRCGAGVLVRTGHACAPRAGRRNASRRIHAPLHVR